MRLQVDNISNNQSVWRDVNPNSSQPNSAQPSSGQSNAGDPLSAETWASAGMTIDVELSQNDILNMFTPAEQQMITDKLHVLGILPQMVGNDFAMPVELNRPGAGWHWDYGVNKVRVDPVDLISKPLNYLRGVMLHEGAHRLLTKQHAVSSPVWEQIGFGILVNAIEDCRINNFVCDSIPDGESHLDELYKREAEIHESAALEEHATMPVPATIRAGLEFIRLWYCERKGQQTEIDPKLPDNIKKIIGETLAVAKEVWWSYPSLDEVRMSPSRVRDYSDATFDAILKRIWPHFKQLVEADLQDNTLAEMLRGFYKGPDLQIPVILASQLSPEELQALMDALISGNLSMGGGNCPSGGVIVLDALPPELKKKLEEFLKSLPDEMQKQIQAQAAQQLCDLGEAINEQMQSEADNQQQKNSTKHASGGATRDARGDEMDGYNNLENNLDRDLPNRKEKLGSTSSAKRKRDRNSLLDEEFANVEDPDKATGQGGPLYETTRKAVAPIMNALEAELRQIFVDRLKRRWTTGHRTGQKISVPKRIRELASDVSAAKSRIFMQRHDPDRVDYAFTLLVDLSGSMRQDNKIQETFKGLVAIVEVLNRLGVKTEVLGFDGSSYIFKEFKESLSTTSRNRLGSMIKAGGGGTSDANAIYVSAKRLMSQRAKEKYLIVLTDGGSGMGHRLNKLISEIREQGQVKLIGIGLGPGTDFVSHYYPNSYPNVVVSKLPFVLSRLIRDSIEEYKKFKM